MTTSALTGDSSIAMLYRQRRDDLNTLVAAVQSGNITDAQSALKAYRQDSDNIKSSASPAHHHAGHGRRPKLQADVSALTSAIQSGSITDAQAALKAYQEDSQAPAQASEAAPAPSDAKSAFVNDFVALVKDALSGDTEAAQKDASALAKDIADLFQESATQAGLPPPTTDAVSSGDAASPAKAVNDVIAAYDLTPFDETPSTPVTV